MDKAAAAVRAGECSVREASKIYGVPKSTLERHKNKKVIVPGCLGRFTPTFDQQFEGELVRYAIEMQARLFGLTITDLRTTAYDLAKINGIEHPFNKHKKQAGKMWVAGFLRRHPELSLRSPEPTSIARAAGFNPTQVGRFYDLVEQAFKDKSYDAGHIWNVDETGLVTVHKPSKVIAKKGQRQVGKITSGERSKTITAVCAFNAAGTYIPPMLVFPRVYMNNRLLTGAPPQTFGVASPSGWIDKVLFKKWFDHFVAIVKPSVDNPHLMFLDGHVSHKSIEVIEAARQNGVTLISFPPHTTHALQPLDCVFFGPLKTFYHQACESFMLRNPGKRIIDYDVAGIFNTAYVAAATIDKGVSGFECTGIYPFNRNKIGQFRFSAALTTDNSTQRAAQENDDIEFVFDPPQEGEDLILHLETSPSNQPVLHLEVGLIPSTAAQPQTDAGVELSLTAEIDETNSCTVDPVGEFPSQRASIESEPQPTCSNTDNHLSTSKPIVRE